jgi:hypothetical protein
MVSTAQDTALVSLQIEAGYEGAFREGYWLPVRVEVSNRGAALTGKLIVRPETSGRVVSNAYSTPLELPAGSVKTTFLYLQARAFPPEITVELLDAEGVRVTQQKVGLQPLESQDRLHVLLTGDTATSIPLNSVRAAGTTARQVRWSAAYLPDYAAALQAVDTLWIIGADTTTLTTAQRQALTLWVLDGGHLVVTGGAEAAARLSAIVDLLPLQPTGTQGVDEVAALARFAQRSERLAQRTIITTGNLREQAVVLAATDDLPLLARWQYGNGTVDYLTVDPALAPLNNWEGAADLWFAIGSTSYPRPFWTQNVLDAQNAALAMSILPGIDLLPPVTSMIAFLVAYIVLIGPVNYWVLSWLNRRGWAWVTIALCILLFSGLAWTVGFNLRGNEVTVSRLNVIRGWAHSDIALLDQFVSVLAPRRGTYTLEVPAERLLRVLPTLSQSGFLQTNVAQSNVEIEQGSQFRAREFAVDGGIFANFGVTGTVAKPAISGEFALVYNADGTQGLQGFIRNDSDITLTEPLLLTRGGSYALGAPLAAGDLVTLDTANLVIMPTKDRQPVASGLEYPYERVIGLRENREIRAQNAQSILEISSTALRAGDGLQTQVNNRRRALLDALLADLYGSPGRGDEVYLVGWAQIPANDVTLLGTPYLNLDTSLFVLQLPVTTTPPRGETVTLHPDQFQWVSLIREAVEGDSAHNLTLLPDSTVVMRYTPLPSAVLRTVQEVTVRVDRSSGYGRNVRVEIWNWATQEWESLGSLQDDEYVLAQPQPYLGAQNAVQIRLALQTEVGSAWIRRLSVVQSGEF